MGKLHTDKRLERKFGVYLPVHAKMGLHLVLRPRRKLAGLRDSLPSSDDIFVSQFSLLLRGQTNLVVSQHLLFSSIEGVTSTQFFPSRPRACEGPPRRVCH